MHPLPPHLVAHLNEALNRSGSTPELKSDAIKWAGFYWDFCRKYGHDPLTAESLPLFHAKLAQKGQSGVARRRAAAAFGLLLKAAKNGGVAPGEGGVSAMRALQSDCSRQPDARFAGLPWGQWRTSGGFD